jgi:hypothetical protein
MSAGMVKLLRGGIHPLHGNAAVRFVAHSHKMVYPGQASPLIIYLEYLEDGRSVEQQQFNVFPEQTREWEWRGYRFILGDYEYGEWMELRIVPLDPAAP